MVNRHKQIYSKRNKEQISSKNKINENRQFVGQLKGLPKAANLVDDMKYKNGHNAFKKFMNNININEEADISSNNNSGNNNSNNINNNNNNSNNNNNAMKNNFVDKKSLGKYMQSQKNKKRNKSNNPLIRPKLNKKTEKSEIREEKLEKPEKKIININTIPKIQNKKQEKNNITKEKNKEINIELNNNYNININYHNAKEKEIILEDYSPEYKVENKFKFNNIPLGNSLLNNNKNHTKEEEKESNINQDKNPTNKFSNTNMLLESGLDIKNIPIYDSIEEVAEWQGGDWNTAQEKGVGDKLIRLDNTKKVEKDDKNNNNINIDDDDILEFGILERKETNRPYTPPIEELVQVNPNKMKGESNMKASLDKKNSLKSTKTFKNYENLIYIEEKGLLFDPLTNKYYDIKAK